MSIYEKLSRVIDELGWVDASIYALNRCLMAFGGFIGIGRFILVAQPIPARSLLPPNRGRSITTRQLNGQDDFGSETTLTPALFAARDALGAICIGAFADDALIGYVCLTLGPHDDEALPIRFNTIPTAKTAWDFDFYICPRYRLGVAYMRLWDAAFDFLRARQIEWAIGYIASYNVPSLRSDTRMGAVPIGSILVIKLGGLQIILRRQSPFFRIAIGRRLRPEISVVAPGYEHHSARYQSGV